MTIWDSIASAINTQIEASLCEKDTAYHGLTILTQRDGKRFPIEDCDEQGVIAIFDDSKAVRIYHRLRGWDAVVKENSFGSSNSYDHIARFSMFVLGIRSRINAGCLGGWVNLAAAVDSALPRSSTWTATGAGPITLNFSSVSLDLDSILQAEFRGYDIKKLNALAVTAAEFSYTVTIKACTDICSVSALVVS